MTCQFLRRGLKDLFGNFDLFGIWLFQLDDPLTIRPFGMFRSISKKQIHHFVKVIWAKLLYSIGSQGKVVL